MASDGARAVSCAPHHPPPAPRAGPCVKLIYMGTPDFAVPPLDALVAAGYPPAAVVTGPDKQRGRGQKISVTAVKAAAERHGLPLLQPESVRDPAFAEQVAALAPDVIAVVAFRILPPEVYEAARLGAFNLHGSLLPAYRGAAPIHRAVMDGVAETGVTTFLLQRTVDTGDVLLRRRLPVGPDETTGDLYGRLAALGADAVVETVRMLEAGDFEPQPQDEAQASAAPKVFPEDGRTDWSRPAAEVHNHVRGLSPSPAAWTYRGDEQLKLYRSRVEAETGRLGVPGEVIEAGPRLVVAAGEGAVEITELQRPGKKRMDAAALLNGYDLTPGDRLTSEPGDPQR